MVGGVCAGPTAFHLRSHCLLITNTVNEVGEGSGGGRSETEEVCERIERSKRSEKLPSESPPNRHYRSLAG